MKALVVNCGSSSVKYQLFDMPEGRVLAKGLIERIGEPVAAGDSAAASERVPTHAAAMERLLNALTSGPDPPLARTSELGVVGHRVVHGAARFTGAVLIDDAVTAAIEQAADLAPLHNPPNLIGIRAAQQALPGVPQVACFDTAFHATIPPVAHLYALPWELYEKYGVRRYGFHGTSHRYVVRRAAQRLGVPLAQFNAISCHLGNGCSATAVRHGQSVDTSMGMTPLEGLAMGTRCGDLDPAILLYLIDKGWQPAALNRCLNKESGLLGLSGASNDMRTLLTRADEGDRRAQLAIDVFAYRLKKYLGAYAAVLGRLDAVVFTGGIGEHAPAIRAASCQGLELMGIRLDLGRNATATGGASDISAADSRVRVLVEPTNEEAAIAAEAYELAMHLPAQP
jgi:acetate kinase